MNRDKKHSQAEETLSDDIDKNGIDKDGIYKSDQWIATELQQHLDSKVESVDFNVSSKLSAARHRALSSDNRSAAGSGLFGKLPGSPALYGGVAVAALTVFIGTTMLQPVPPVEQSTQMTQSQLIEDMNLLSATEDLEFFESMEFLEWMESNSG